MLEISQTITTLSTRRVKLDFNPPQEEKKNMGNLKIPAFFPPVIGEQNPYRSFGKEIPNWLVVSTPLKNMLVKMGSSSLIFGVNIKNI